MGIASGIDAGSAQQVLRALSDAIEATADQPSLDPVLTRLVVAARDLADATYAAIGIPEPEGDAFARFITIGMSDELVERLGPLPRTHGMLDAMLHDPAPYRTDDITREPRFRGWWPAAHPRMRSFLGMPIVSRGDVIGAFYLTDKIGAPEFTEDDERRIALLAAHAAIAIENARLFEDSRALALVEERDRMARELHDAMNQSLFSLTLTARAAAAHLPERPDHAAAELANVEELARRALGELRDIVTGLRPPDLERDGLVSTFRSQIELLARLHGTRISLETSGEPALDDLTEHETYRIVQEALTNALRHSGAGAIGIRIDATGENLLVELTDDGVGFDPTARAVRSRRLGLTSMYERAGAIGATLDIDSAPGEGTKVTLRVPHG